MARHENWALILLGSAWGGGFGFVGREGCLVFFGMTVPMRWLLLGLLISVFALVLVVGAVVRHIRRQRKTLPQNEPEAAGEERRGKE
jgi:hypothetical protein